MPHDRITYGIYNWDFVSIMGVPQPPTRELKTIKMPGVDGCAFKFMSMTAKPTSITMLAAALDDSDEEDWIRSMAELSGRQVTLWSSTGIPYYSQVFHEVLHQKTQKVGVGAYGPYSLGSTGRLLTFQATVQYPYGY